MLPALKRRWVKKTAPPISVRKFSDSVKTELTEELRIQELHSNLKKAEQADMKNLSPEIAESIKSLKDAAEMVNRPYQLDKEPENIVIEKVTETNKIPDEVESITDAFCSPYRGLL